MNPLMIAAVAALIGYSGARSKSKRMTRGLLWGVGGYFAVTKGLPMLRQQFPALNA